MRSAVDVAEFLRRARYPESLAYTTTRPPPQKSSLGPEEALSSYHNVGQHVSKALACLHVHARQSGLWQAAKQTERTSSTNINYSLD